MPHKHSRRKGDDDSHFNLPPTSVARPLPSYNKELKDRNRKPSKWQEVHQPRKNFSHSYKGDDTPRAFMRIMQFQKTGRKRKSGLDDGLSARGHKKVKMVDSQTPADSTPETTNDDLRIMPGERLADFAARVDQTLPVGGLMRKGKGNVEGLPERQTRTEKRLHKMYAAWREEDARIKERLEEQQELDDEAAEEREAAMGDQSLDFDGYRKTKGKRLIGEEKDDNEDPWAVLRSKRSAPRGLHDVVQAPPTLQPLREKLKTKNGAIVDVADTPASAGSLKRREELSVARKEVIERYRAMMKK